MRGVAWANPAGLSWSHWVERPRGVRNCPDQSGYFDSSCAVASSTDSESAARSARAAIERLEKGILTSLALVFYFGLFAHDLFRKPASTFRDHAIARSVSRGVEVAQVRRLLALLRGHQIAVGAHKVVLLADHDVIIVLGAEVLVPFGILLAPIVLHHFPWFGQRVVDGGDLVHECIGT